MVEVKTKFMFKKEFEQYDVLVCSLIFKQYCWTTEDDTLSQGYHDQVETDDAIFESN